MLAAFAIVIGLSGSAVGASERSQREQAAAAKDMASSLREIVRKGAEPEKPDPLTLPCAEGNYDKRGSDLCAQWKAADAARSAATATWWSVLLTGLATIGAGITIGFTVAATRAANISARAAIETLHANRAWMAFSGWQQGSFSGQLDGKKVTNGQVFNTIFQNYGASPALNCRIQRHFEIIDISSPVQSIAVPEDKSAGNSTVVATGQKINSYAILLNDQQAHDFRSRKTKVVCVFEVVYNDIYSVGKKEIGDRVTRLAFVIEHLGGTVAKKGNVEENIDVEPLGHLSIAT
ncbi:hypothetical protein J2Y58_002908 [Sphingomonas sp. BE138]|uniref:hypothetical protein n=1 Tax=Sphingomonas sp. BE138 TaxID=2817845 RepID=UPI00285F9C7C|nr:hypothetical protein [Sphingomonas sp. BE138]MDR6789535.1 hypothetical protein [Sphingomonas sp. BE138]